MTEQHALNHPYLRYAGGSAEPHEDLHGHYLRVISVRSGAVLRLLEEEHRLAQLFDGERSVAQRLAAAQALQPELSLQDLDALTQELADHDLLFPGSEEPLPVPAQTDQEAALGRRLDEGGHEQAFPPGSEPGSLGGRASLGPLAGSVWRGRVDAEQIDVPISPRWGAWLGALFGAPTRWGIVLWGLLLAAVALLWALWRDQGAAAADVQRLLAWDNLLMVGLPSFVATNLISQWARAWVSYKETGSWPRFGIVWAFGVIPRFVTDTEGPAELAERRARMRIVAAPLVASLILFLIALVGWFVVRQSTTMLPAVLITAAMIGLANTLLRANPLGRTDGYYLLSQWLGVPDLREQAFLSLLGLKVMWGNRQAPERGPLVLYGLLVLAFLVLVMGLIVVFPGRWLEGRYGGTGVFVLLAITTVYAISLHRRYKDRRQNLGRAPWRPRLDGSLPAARRWAPIFALAAFISLWPYTYEPGGRVKLQPQTQADVSVSQSGTVAKILVREGDWVDEGSLLLRLDTASIDAQILRAESEVARLQAQLDRARNGATREEVALAEQRVATARARLRFSEAEASRAEAALGRRAVTTQERDRAVAQAEVDRETLAQEEANLEFVRSPTRDEDIMALESELAAQQAELAFFQTERDQSELRAPLAGTVVGEDWAYLLGRHVEAGSTLAQIVNTRELEALLMLPEFAAGSARPQQAARIKIWALPEQAFAGEVIDIAPVAEAGENGRVIRVRIALDDEHGLLRADMTGQAKIEGETMPLLLAYTRALLRFALVEVWSWLP